MYQDQANELDIVVNRLRNLVNALKVRGVYDKAMDELAKISELYKAPDLTFMPIPDYRMLAEKGGLDALISTLPIEEIAAAIGQLTEREAKLKERSTNSMAWPTSCAALPRPAKHSARSS